MDYVDGYTFGSLQNRKKRISESDALIVCESVADAMKYAWDLFGTVHCDLKPENIMVDRDGTVKVMISASASPPPSSTVPTTRTR
jgi:serine/threonine protein kinase